MLTWKSVILNGQISSIFDLLEYLCLRSVLMRAHVVNRYVKHKRVTGQFIHNYTVNAMIVQEFFTLQIFRTLKNRFIIISLKSGDVELKDTHPHAPPGVIIVN